MPLVEQIQKVFQGIIENISKNDEKVEEKLKKFNSLDPAAKRLRPTEVFYDIRELYGPSTYLSRYGADFLKAAGIIFVVAVGVTFVKLSGDINQIRENWPQERCKPTIMPLAGYINAPPGTSPLNYTVENFNICTVEMINAVFNKAVEFVYYIISQIISVFRNAVNSLHKIRALLDRMRQALKEIFEKLFNIILNVIIPVQTILIKMFDFMKKVQGMLLTFIYTLMGAYMTMVSLVGAIFEIVIIILVVMAIVIAILWALPFVGWVYALAMTIIFLLIAIPLIIIGVFAGQVMKRRGSSVPRVD